MGLSKAERDKRFARGQQSAREAIAAKEIFSLRLSPATILSIYEIANGRKMHASDLVRGWIEQSVIANTSGQRSESVSVVNESSLMYTVRQAVREELYELGVLGVDHRPSAEGDGPESSLSVSAGAQARKSRSLRAGSTSAKGSKGASLKPKNTKE